MATLMEMIVRGGRDREGEGGRGKGGKSGNFPAVRRKAQVGTEEEERTPSLLLPTGVYSVYICHIHALVLYTFIHILYMELYFNPR